MTTRSCIDNAWVTLNRACNLRCRWCYAAGTGYKAAEDMPFELFREIIDFLPEIGVRRVTLTGGEPTLYPYMPDAVRYCRDHGLSVSLPTNGLVFASRGRVEEYCEAGVDRVGMSVKAHDRQSCLDATGVDCFDDVVRAISNLAGHDDLRLVILTVVTPDNKDHTADVIRMARDAGATSFGLLPYRSFGCLDGTGGRYGRSDIERNVVGLADYFASHMDELSTIAGGKIQVEHTLPQCLWDPAFADMLVERSWLTGPCQLHGHDGLIFDTEGYILPCNAMHSVRLGRIHEDFRDRESFRKFWSSCRIEDALPALNRIPDEKCSSCSRFDKCRGGCISNWLNYSFVDIRAYLHGN